MTQQEYDKRFCPHHYHRNEDRSTDCPTCALEAKEKAPRLGAWDGLFTAGEASSMDGELKGAAVFNANGALFAFVPDDACIGGHPGAIARATRIAEALNKAPPASVTGAEEEPPLSPIVERALLEELERQCVAVDPAPKGCIDKAAVQLRGVVSIAGLASAAYEVMARGDGEMVTALREARLALEPIARRVFNDNGDHTINTEAFAPDVYSACYYAAQTVADALAHRSSGHEG